MEDHSKTCKKKATLDRTNFVNFVCASCAKTYVNKKKMDDHNGKCMQKKLFSQKVLEMKRQISEQTFQVTKSILELKEAEFEERISCRRECKPGCKIFHTKHNWCKNKSNKYLENLEGIRKAFVENIATGTIQKSYSCKICDNIFNRVCDLKMHQENVHRINKENTEEFQESNDVLMTEDDSISSKDSKSDDVESIDRCVQNLCYICLLSFNTEHNLKEHIQKHSTVKVLPSILINH